MSQKRLDFFELPPIKDMRKERTESGRWEEKKHIRTGDIKELVDIVENCAPSEVCVLTERVIPPQFYSAQNFIKRGDAVQLEYPRSLEEVCNGVVSGTIHGPRRTRDKAFQKATQGFHAGYEWFTPDLKRRRVLFDTSIHGFRLYFFCLTSPYQNDKIIVHKRKEQRLPGYHSKAESPKIGWTYDVEVPSCSREVRHPLQLTGVPTIALDPERVNVIRRLSVWDHGLARSTDGDQRGCQLQHYLELTFRDIMIFCHHAIAAYFEVSRQIKEETKRFPLQPFAIPKPHTLEIDRRLRKQTLRAFIDKNGDIGYRRLNLAEREIFWGHFLLKHNDDLLDKRRNPFYAIDGIPKYKQALNL